MTALATTDASSPPGRDVCGACHELFSLHRLVRFPNRPWLYCEACAADFVSYSGRQSLVAERMAEHGLHGRLIWMCVAIVLRKRGLKDALEFIEVLAEDHAALAST